MGQLYFNFHLIMLNGRVNLHLQALHLAPLRQQQAYIFSTGEVRSYIIIIIINTTTFLTKTLNKKCHLVVKHTTILIPEVNDL